MKGLDTLIKLYRRRLDEQRRQMVALERQRDALKAQLAALAESLVREGDLAGDNGALAPGFPTFLAATLARRTTLENAILEMDARIAEAYELLAELFQETKRYEVAAQRRDLRARDLEARRSQATLDEIGLVQFRLKKGASKNQVP